MIKPTPLARSVAVAALTGALMFNGGISGALPVSAQVRAVAFTVSGKVPAGQGPVRVVLYRWPSQSTTAALKPGHKVPLTVLASQTTSSGGYALKVDLTALGVTMGAIVNLQVVAASADGATGTFSFPRKLVTDHAGQPVLAGLFGKPQMAPQIANLRLSPSSALCPHPYNPVALMFKKNIGEKWVIMGALYSRAGDITARFTYENGQRSSLGVGLSAVTKFAHFSESGTHSVSSSAEVGFPSFHGHTAHLYKTEFRYGKYRWWCQDLSGQGVWGAWQVQANDFGGGASSPKLSQSPDARYCTSWEANSTFRKSATSAYNFTKGASLSDVIGIDLSAQTGYDNEARLAYVVGNKGRDICGFKGPPAGDSPPPRLIVAGAP
jgi:hypothetical protein